MISVQWLSDANFLQYRGPLGIIKEILPLFCKLVSSKWYQVEYEDNFN